MRDSLKVATQISREGTLIDIIYFFYFFTEKKILIGAVAVGAMIVIIVAIVVTGKERAKNKSPSSEKNDTKNATRGNSDDNHKGGVTIPSNGTVSSANAEQSNETVSATTGKSTRNHTSIISSAGARAPTPSKMTSATGNGTLDNVLSDTSGTGSPRIPGSVAEKTSVETSPQSLPSKTTDGQAMKQGELHDKDAAKNMTSVVASAGLVVNATADRVTVFSNDSSSIAAASLSVATEFSKDNLETTASFGNPKDNQVSNYDFARHVNHGDKEKKNTINRERPTNIEQTLGLGQSG